MDVKILKYLENDARNSLKKLADTMKKKTSTIYNRLQRMQDNKIIYGYGVIFNHEKFNIEIIAQIKISLKPLQIKNFDNMFIHSFSKYLKDEFKQILFIGVLDDFKQISCIVPFKTQGDFDEFIGELKKNPYIETISSEIYTEIIKGERIFNFNENFINFGESSEKDDEDDEKDDEDESDED